MFFRRFGGLATQPDETGGLGEQKADDLAPYTGWLTPDVTGGFGGPATQPTGGLGEQKADNLAPSHTGWPTPVVNAGGFGGPTPHGRKQTPTPYGETFGQVTFLKSPPVPN